jgi:CRP/FNR family transcriptional regulator, cyclic AMP receptor protein
MHAADQANAKNALSNQGWLPLTPPSFREAVLGKCHVRSFERGEPVYKRDDPPGGLFGLASGGVALEIAPGMRSPYIAHFLRPGMWFGAAALLSGERRRVGIIATRPSVVLHLSAAAFKSLASDDPEAWRWLSLILLLNNDLAVSVCDDLMIRDPKARATAILLRLAGCIASDATEDAPSELNLTHEELAVITNLSRSTVGALLRAYETQGWISQTYRRIVIRNTEALRACCSS